MRTFGIDEPMGCYDDMEHADAFVLGVPTWPRCTPSSVVAHHRPPPHRQTRQDPRPIHLQPPFLRTGRRRTDLQPQSDLAILNYICNHIIQNGAVNQAFVDKHVKFAKGVTDIGYGL